MPQYFLPPASAHEPYTHPPSCEKAAGLAHFSFCAMSATLSRLPSRSSTLLWLSLSLSLSCPSRPVACDETYGTCDLMVGRGSLSYCPISPSITSPIPIPLPTSEPCVSDNLPLTLRPWSAVSSHQKGAILYHVCFLGHLVCLYTIARLHTILAYACAHARTLTRLLAALETSSFLCSRLAPCNKCNNPTERDGISTTGQND